MGKWMGIFRPTWIDQECCARNGLLCTPEEAQKSVVFGSCLLLAVLTVLAAAIVAVLL